MIWVLVLARVLQGISASVVWTIGLAMVMDTVGSGKLGVTIGSIFSLISVGELIAPVFGGLVFKKAGAGAVFGTAFGLLVIDFLMRLVVIEKKVAVTYGVDYSSGSEDTDSEDGETSPLLSNGNTKEEELAKRRLAIHTFDSPSPGIRSHRRPRRRPLWRQDIRYLRPPLPLRTPHAGGSPEITKMATILSFCGLGLATLSSPSIVEASYVVEQFHLANEELFGEQGPYGQLYAVSSMVFSAGLTVGPVVSGGLRDRIGYGNMNAVVAGLCVVVSALSWVYLGRIPKTVKRGRGSGSSTPRVSD